MQIRANRPASGQTLPDTVLEILSNIATRKRLLSTWNWSPDPSLGNGKKLRLSWRLDVGWEQRALAELRRMSDRELADIGLSRSDLTLDGLTIAGSKRALKQDAVAAEIGEMTKVRGTDQHGN